METILKLLTSLKTNEKSILITIIANALVLYLICFVGFEKFQTYQWYQQLIIPCALSVSYSATHFFLCFAFSICIPTLGNFRDNVYNVIDSNIIWYSSIYCLGISSLISLINFLFSADHNFPFIPLFKGIMLISWCNILSISNYVYNWKNHWIFTSFYIIIYAIFSVGVYILYKYI